jgi:hypothetical protein
VRALVQLLSRHGSHLPFIFFHHLSCARVDCFALLFPQEESRAPAILLQLSPPEQGEPKPRQGREEYFFFSRSTIPPSVCVSHRPNCHIAALARVAGRVSKSIYSSLVFTNNSVPKK